MLNIYIGQYLLMTQKVSKFVIKHMQKRFSFFCNIFSLLFKVLIAQAHCLSHCTIHQVIKFFELHIILFVASNKSKYDRHTIVHLR